MAHGVQIFTTIIDSEVSKHTNGTTVLTGHSLQQNIIQPNDADDDRPLYTNTALSVDCLRKTPGQYAGYIAVGRVDGHPQGKTDVPLTQQLSSRLW